MDPPYQPVSVLPKHTLEVVYIQASKRSVGFHRGAVRLVVTAGTCGMEKRTLQVGCGLRRVSWNGIGAAGIVGLLLGFWAGGYMYGRRLEGSPGYKEGGDGDGYSKLLEQDDIFVCIRVSKIRSLKAEIRSRVPATSSKFISFATQGVFDLGYGDCVCSSVSMCIYMLF